MWLIEDNASLHSKAAADQEEERVRRGINKVNWPVKSPDLNMIEQLWNYLKDSLSCYWIIGQSDLARKQSQGALSGEMDQLPQDYLNQLAASFKDHCETVKDQKGDNKYNG